ncbi:PE-PPE domain-containing protein [Mycolicibacterium lacusdiani]|uniref:PE-PPE domain-containing protein n=1 Tax=Mycolicibacterium lacusdiani TaxID=2895283 RepID=UPI001F1ECD37|nr:PE-PPE domain-containing protein [Mycolicibacterium lacusdiani]
MISAVTTTTAALTVGLTAPTATAATLPSPAYSHQDVALAAATFPTFADALAALGIDVPSLDQLIPIPTTIPIPGGDPIDLPVKVITTGPPFGALGILGLNPTWVPAFPSEIANAINTTPYGGIDTDISIPVSVPNPLYQPAYNAAYGLATLPKFLGGGGCSASNTACRTTFALNAVKNIPQVIDANPSVPIEVPNLRVPIVIAFGLGSLATGMAYPDVVADLPNQPGGTGTGAEPGTSLTILPMILLRNPGRADGGLAARFAPLLDSILVGLGQNSVVTPEVGVETDGGAVLVPIKVDATVEYDPLSDFAAWPNPFTLANNGAALLFPSYILRGSDITGALPQVLEPVLASVLGNAVSAAIGDGLTASGIPIIGSLPLPRSVLVPLVNSLLGTDISPGDDYYEALNQFLTIEANALPLLEPFRYPTDVANLFTGGAFGFTNPFADAFEPALKLLVNLGYTNVTQDMTNPLDPYPRDFSGNFGSEFAPFLSFPDVDYGRVPGDLLTALVAGTQSAFFSGVPGVRGPLAGPNPLAIIAGLLGLPTGPTALPGLLDAFPDLGNVIGGNLGLPQESLATLAAPAGADSVALAAADSNDPLVRFGEVVANTVAEFQKPGAIGYQDYTPTTGPVDSAADVIEGLGASGLRLLASLVLGPARLATLASGDPDALRDLIENTIDAPLYVADPAIFGVRDALPSGLAPGITNVRNTVQGASDQINGAVLPNVPDVPSAPTGGGAANSTATGTTLVKSTDADTTTVPKTPAKKPEFNVVRDNPISGAIKGVHDGLAEAGKNLQKVFTPPAAEKPETGTSTPADGAQQDAAADGGDSE